MDLSVLLLSMLIAIHNGAVLNGPFINVARLERLSWQGLTL